MSQFNPQQRALLDQALQTDPVAAKKVLDALGKGGYDVSGFDIPHDWTDETAAFGAGVPEGATYGYLDYPDTGSLATTVDLPLLGEVQPARELGRLAGGMLTGGALWKTGYRVAGKAAGRAAGGALKQMGAGSKNVGRAMKVGRVAGAATPEAIVGSVVAGQREGSWEAAARALPEWYLLGAGSELGMQKLAKLWRRRKAGKVDPLEEKEVTAQIKEDLAKRDADLDTAQQGSGEADYKRFDEVGPYGPDVSDDLYFEVLTSDLTPQEVIRKMDDQGRLLKGQEIALDIRPSANKSHYVTEGGDVIALDASDPGRAYIEELDNSLSRVTKQLEGKGLSTKRKDMLIKQRDEIQAHALRARNFNGPRRDSDSYYKGLSIEETPLMDSELPVQIVEDRMLIDSARLIGWFKAKVWTKGIGDVPGLPKTAFSTQASFRSFMQERVYLEKLWPEEQWADKLWHGNGERIDEYQKFLTRESRGRVQDGVRESPKRPAGEMGQVEKDFNENLNYPDDGVVYHVAKSFEGLESGTLRHRTPSAAPNDEAGVYFSDMNDWDGYFAGQVRYLFNQDVLDANVVKGRRGPQTREKEIVYTKDVPLSKEAGLKEIHLISAPTYETYAVGGLAQGHPQWEALGDAVLIPQMMRDDIAKWRPGLEKKAAAYSKKYGVVVKVVDPEIPGDVPMPANTPTQELEKRLGILDYVDDSVAPGDGIQLENKAGQIHEVTVVRNDRDYWEVTTSNGNTRKMRKDVWTPKGMVKGVSGGTGIEMGPSVSASIEQRQAILTRALRLGELSDTNIPYHMFPDDMTHNKASEIIDALDERLSVRGMNEADRMLDIQDTVARGEGGVKGLTDAPDPEVHLGAQRATVEELAQAPGALHNVAGPYSTFGMGKNRFVKEFMWNYTASEQEIKQSFQEKLTQMYSKVRESVGLPAKMTIGEQVKAKLGRLSGRGSKYDVSRQKLFRVAQALDTNYDPTRNMPEDWDEGMVNAFKLYREMMDEVANHLQLPKDKRVSFYLHHTFGGKAGRLVSQSIASHVSLFNSKQAQWILDMAAKTGNLDDLAEDTLVDILSGKAKKVYPRGYRALKERSGATDYTYDLDAITLPVIYGSTERVFSTRINKRFHDVLMNIPHTDTKGRINEMPKVMADFARHVTGRSTAARTKVAGIWADSRGFNSGIDRLVQSIGGAPEGLSLTRAAAKTRTGDPVDPQMQEMGMNWLDELQRTADSINPITGELTRNLQDKTQAHIRAKVALKIEDMRQALSNPNLSGPVANAIYRTLIVAKLGLNMAHGLVNLTQTLVNTYPLLKSGYTSRAIEDFAFSGTKKIRGRTVSEILEEAGVAGDITSTEEFMGVLPSTMKTLQEKALIFSRKSEQFNRSVAFLGKYREVLDSGTGHGSAMEQSRMFVEKTQFPFNRAGTPAVLRGPLLRLLFMFKSYPIHQTDFTATMVKDAWGSVKAKGGGIKGFAQALEDGDLLSLQKHIMAYATLIGGGMALLPETNFADRNTPPAAEMAMEFVQGIGRYGTFGSAANVAFGPAADTATHAGRAATDWLEYVGILLELTEGNAKDALDQGNANAARFAGSMIPTLIRKGVENAISGDEANVLEMLSLKKFEPKSRGRRNALALPSLQEFSSLKTIGQ